jgi:hypothetical protein
VPGFEQSILTDVGLEALTDAEAGQHIEYTHMEAGDGDIYGGDTEIYGMTALAHHVMDFPITNFSNDGAGQITLIGVISSKNVTAGFYFKELGVRCTIDGGTPILYTVSYAGATGDYIPASTETPVVIQTVQIIIRIDRAPNVTVIVQPGLDVTAQNIGPATVGPGYFRDKIGQVLWFKRINSPRHTLNLSETTDVVSIDLPDITENLDMYVALGNPDIFPNFSTIQNALNYLRPRRIAHQIMVKINVSAGVWLNSATITVNHPQGVQIQIIGTIGPQLNVSTASKDAQNNVTLNAPAGTFSNIAVGDWILHQQASNYIGMGTSGVWKVTARAADGSSLTYFCHHWGTLPAQGGVVNGKVNHLKTVIEFAANTHGMSVQEGGLDLLQNMVLKGTGSGGFNGLVTYGRLNLVSYVGFSQWGPQANAAAGAGGVAIYPAGGSSVYCSNCAACICYDGFWAGNSGTFMGLTSCYATGCWRFGLYTEGGGLTMNIGIACGCKNTGIECSGASSVVANNCYAIGNAGNGLDVQWNSFCACSPVNGGSYLLNGSKDIHVVVSSSVIRVGTPISYSTTNIAPNVLTADGCWFSP